MATQQHHHEKKLTPEALALHVGALTGFGIAFWAIALNPVLWPLGGLITLAAADRVLYGRDPW